MAQRRRPKWAVAKPGTSAEDTSPYQSRAISRALDVLEAFEDEHAALNLRDLSRLTGLPDASLFRILVTLQGRGYLQQNEDGSYRLAHKLLLGKVSERAERLRALAKPELQALSLHLNETASLAYLFADHIQVIESIDSLHDMRISNRPGRVLPPHCSAMGKAITAFQAQPRIDRILEVYGLAPRTIHSLSDRRELIAELARVRETGLAYDREESTLGGICIAAAIQLPGGRVLGALSVSTPVARLTPERERETSDAVLKTARTVAQLEQSLQ